MHCRRITSGFGALLLLFLGAAPAFAQFGLKPITKEEYQRIPKATLPAGGYGEMPTADLSQDMPPPGNQNPQGSCAAWASAYAAMTYLEDRDHGWRPDSAEHIFSPSFIYNQRVLFEYGMSLSRETLPLLQKKGCATLATMPYVPRDDRAPPSDKARQEARHYRISSFARVQSGAEIRKWLQAKHPVVIGAYALGLSTLNYHVYTKKEWNEVKQYPGMTAELIEGSRHAMCIVGYDDNVLPHGAFKVMNSWGDTWGPNDPPDGFVWIDYDLMRTLSPGLENFCQEAYVLFTAAPAPRPRPGQTVAAVGQSWYAGFRDGEHIWGWKAFLTAASAEPLSHIAKVVWKVPDAAGRSSEVPSSNPAVRFEVGSQLRQAGSYTVSGTVYFDDDHRQEVSCTLTLAPPASTRSLKLAQSDHFWGTVEGTRFYEFTLKLEGGLTDLGDVKQVTYHLHPTMRDPNPVVRQSAENGFAYTTTAWGTFPVRATVLFRDDTTLKLKLPLQFHDQPREELSLTNTARFLGKGADGKLYYAWTAFLQGPAQRLKEIKSVHYTLHPSFDKPVVDVDSGREHGFPLTATGWGRFPLKARVFFQDGSTKDFSHDLLLSPADSPPSPRKDRSDNHFEPPVGPDPSAPPSPPKGHEDNPPVRPDAPGPAEPPPNPPGPPPSPPKGPQNNPVTPPIGPNPPGPVGPFPNPPGPLPSPPSPPPGPTLPPSPSKGLLPSGPSTRREPMNAKRLGAPLRG